MSTSGNHPQLRLSTSHLLRSSQDPPASSVSYLSQIESLILPDGPLGEETAELLQDFVHPHRHDTEDTLVENSVEDTDGERAARNRLPRWKRPAPWWLMVALPFAAIASSATIAPRIEVYTILACHAYRPDHTTNLTVTRRLESPPADYYGGSFAPKPLIATNVGSWDGVSQDCASDPDVQAAVAKLTTVMSATMGILSCLTAVWWGAFSDRNGRISVMGISIIGLLLTDVNFLLVSHFSRQLPGGYWFLLWGPVIEGCLGGMTSATAAMHAYISDTTGPGARARAFSFFLGVLFTGVALGPTLGGILIRMTNNVLSVFYAATLMHLIYTFLVCFIIPESLFRFQMAASRIRLQEELAKLKEEREGVFVGVLVRIRRVFGFLSPLAILVPTPIVVGGNPLKCPKRDWNLTLVAAAYWFTIMLMGAYSYKFQYAASTFHWSSEIIGYYISLVGAARAAYLVLVLPLAIKFLKPKKPPIQLPLDANLPPLPSEEHHSPSFDLNLARVSLIIEVISYASMGLARTPVAFTLFTILGSFGVGFSPGVHSVALDLYQRRGEKDNGRLFGALSVVQALGSQIIGPAIFGFTYIKTVRAFPPAIFFLSTTGAFVSLILLSFVRLPKESCTRDEPMDEAEDQASSTLPRPTATEALVASNNDAADTRIDNDPSTNGPLVDV